MSESDSQPVTAGKPKASARRKARSFALQALYGWHVADLPLSDIEAQYRTDNDFAKVDGAYFHELLTGVGKNLTELDECLATVLDRPVKELDPIELATLRIGVYELMFRIDVPYKVVINEGIELAKTFGATDGHKYVNGILDKLAPRLRSAEVNASRRGR
ncbi:transcription antitermination factor NusB [Halopseudomonas pelagia]|uniref:Transcription antitermination protein NusB n=1 Tax=Halopseudomonas pelagia TaxID=553151 RepID=A0AA91U120_9GAMM|nr:transcription antitermination factor NusB [Halopseudomonas pelagia]PCC98620.1 transcription antitermination factor NusB [Halopseudomonas pelagia]QFY55582.1 transcription antitermination factor NusB [Halopseudomonas pelagia]